MTFKTIRKFLAATALLLAVGPALGADEIDRAAQLLSQHQMSCQAGARGWWLKLDSQVINHSERGGIHTSDGKYWGCGSCGDCRSYVNKEIDQTLSSLSKYCTDRDGTVKTQNRGKWSEDVHPDFWDIKTEGVTILCEKWIDC